MATALAVVSLIGTAVGAVQSRKASKRQRRQNKVQNKIAAIQRTRATKRNIAASRIQIAQQQSVGFQLGVGGGTAVQGATQGVLGDTATSLGAANTQFEQQQISANFANSQSRLQSNIATTGAITSITGGLATNPQAVASLEDAFGTGG